MLAGGAAPGDDALRAWLDRAHRLGFVGPEIEGHLARAEAFAAGFADPPGRALDLGTGAGLPGLVLARRWPACSWVLVDRSLRRTSVLTEAVRQMGLVRQVTVVNAAAEELAHDEGFRQAFEAVVARGFAPPAVTAECAAGFLAPGGWLGVAEPPGGAVDRWPPERLASLGLAWVRRAEGIAFLQQVEAAPHWAPRRWATMKRRPMFGRGGHPVPRGT